MRPRIYFQRVPEAKVARNRVHLDLNVVGRRAATGDERRELLAAEAERLVSLGAGAELVWGEDHEIWVVMTDPEGNEFCLQ